VSTIAGLTVAFVQHEQNIFNRRLEDTTWNASGIGGRPAVALADRSGESCLARSRTASAF